MSQDPAQFHGTTIVSVRRGERVAMGGDGQVTLGAIVIKASARKVRRKVELIDSLTDGAPGAYVSA